MLLLQRGTVGFGQMTIVEFAQVALFLVQFRFLFFQSAGFSSRELTVLNTVRNAVLLILFALVDGGRLAGCAGRGLRRGRQNHACNCHCQENASRLHSDVRSFGPCSDCWPGFPGHCR